MTLRRTNRSLTQVCFSNEAIKTPDDLEAYKSLANAEALA